MNHNYVFGNVNEALPYLMRDLLTGRRGRSRLGDRTLEMTHVGITLTQPWQREIVLPERKASIAAQIAETMWVLSGRTDIGWLSHYLPRAIDFSDNGSTWRAGYGARLRNYHGVDQIAYIIDLLRRSPGSRQAVVTIWDPTVDTQPGKDIACNNWLHFISRLGRLDLMVGIRSNDSIWGWSGINAFEWSALQEIVAGILGLEVGSLHFAVGSFHLYDRHWEKARHISRQGGNFMYDDSPRFNATGIDDMHSFDEMARQWFEAEAEIRSQASLPAHDRNLEGIIDDHPEPMTRSWLRVLAWYWTGEPGYLEPLRHTWLAQACLVGTKPASASFAGRVLQVEEITQMPPLVQTPGFLDHVNALHAEKHAAYGDSWKRRGEYMILANIARKVDRLEGGSETADETQTDTAIDLLVYLAKYRCWINGGSGDPDEVAAVLDGITGSYSGSVEHIIWEFEELENAEPGHKLGHIDRLLGHANVLARSRWSR